MCIVRAYVCVKFVSWTEWKRAIVIRVKYKKQKNDTEFVVDAIGHTQHTVQCILNIRVTRTTKLTTKPFNGGAEFYNSTHSLSCYVLASRCGEETTLAFTGYIYWYKRESQKRNNFARHSRLGFCLFFLVVSGALLISMAHTKWARRKWSKSKFFFLPENSVSDFFLLFIWKKKQNEKWKKIGKLKLVRSANKKINNNNGTISQELLLNYKKERKKTTKQKKKRLEHKV